MEYGPIYRKRSDLPIGLIDVGAVTAWCPACFRDSRPVAEVRDLPAYLGVLASLYARVASPPDGNESTRTSPGTPWSLTEDDLKRAIEAHPYLQRLRAGS
jgi:hypothetical protein